MVPLPLHDNERTRVQGRRMAGWEGMGEELLESELLPAAVSACSLAMCSLAWGMGRDGLQGVPLRSLWCKVLAFHAAISLSLKAK